MSLLNNTLRIADIFKSFGGDRKGGVALMAGIAFPMIFVGAGGALDYSNAVTAKNKAQRAMDSTVLALTRRDFDTNEAQTEGEKMFKSLLAQRGIPTPPTEVQFNVSDARVSGSALVDSKNYFLGIVGMDSISAKVESAAIPPADRPIEIALVLDVSGSMSSDLNGMTRMTRMKQAVNDMFDTLDDTLPSGAKVRASVVPYSTSVNISNYANAAKGSSVSGQAKGLDVWAAERSEGSTGDSFSVNDAGPNIKKIPFVTATEMGSAAPTARMEGLTENIADVRTTVGAMSPEGWTAGHIGMAWGVYSLSEKWKNFWPKAPEAKGDSDKIIVFLSDGIFNTTHNIGAQSNDDGITSDAYFQDMCELARDEGMTIYTVALALDPVSEAKLGDCVGSTGKVYSADSANELSNAFEDIARRLGTHRLTS